MTPETTRPWTTWADFDDDGEPTGRTIIGDLDACRAVFCTVDATPGGIAVAAQLPEMHNLLVEAARLMPGGTVARDRWIARVAEVLGERGSQR